MSPFNPSCILQYLQVCVADGSGARVEAGIWMQNSQERSNQHSVGGKRGAISTRLVERGPCSAERARCVRLQQVFHAALHGACSKQTEGKCTCKSSISGVLDCGVVFLSISSFTFSI